MGNNIRGAEEQDHSSAPLSVGDLRHRSDLHLVRQRLNEGLQMEATLATSEEIFDSLFAINRILGAMINGYYEDRPESELPRF